MINIKIVREDTDTKGRYIARVDELEGEGELTFSKASEQLIIVDHTAVSDGMRGKGIARALATRVISDARDAGQRIVPLCPFMRSYADRHHEETADVIQR
ncbi:N-acetyltransferase [Parasedimentitalea marina]|uniref:N-acetyltransferase n=1 Tax=Parasedimentitalea marina TaxID=2483033 RepID=A0A3T0N7C9_9RHOB|nr:GNAT family N-acetyltransferase [Parasedimentitalea marina]AZV79907.1 N-acetyltransferase [Parasedimentitalea marina]